jgi:hypothetical protein
MFQNEDDQVYRRDITNPTLEDHFDKTVLPKVMQVKNFGRSGRTKYTHLVDQDTTSVIMMISCVRTLLPEKTTGFLCVLQVPPVVTPDQ